MSATVANAIKAYIEKLGLGVDAYRDAAPFDVTKPYITIVEGISVVPDGYGDGGSGETGAELVQVDVWEDWKDEDEVLVESDLALSVARAMHGARLETAPTRVYGVSLISRRRLLEPDTNTVHNAITANVRRTL